MQNPSNKQPLPASLSKRDRQAASLLMELADKAGAYSLRIDFAKRGVSGLIFRRQPEQRWLQAQSLSTEQAAAAKEDATTKENVAPVRPADATTQKEAAWQTKVRRPNKGGGAGAQKAARQQAAKVDRNALSARGSEQTGPKRQAAKAAAPAKEQTPAKRPKEQPPASPGSVSSHELFAGSDLSDLYASMSEDSDPDDLFGDRDGGGGGGYVDGYVDGGGGIVEAQRSAARGAQEKHDRRILAGYHIHFSFTDPDDVRGTDRSGARFGGAGEPALPAEVRAAWLRQRQRGL